MYESRSELLADVHILSDFGYVVIWMLGLVCMQKPMYVLSCAHVHRPCAILSVNGMKSWPVVVPNVSHYL